MDFINHWLGGNGVTLGVLEQLWKRIPKQQPVSIGDLGCGSGEILRLIAKKASQQNRNVNLTGMDANAHIVDYARNQSRDLANVKFEVMNIFSNEFQSYKFDFVIATLFLHHFSDEELINLFASLKKQTRIGIIVNDLHRHPIAVGAFYAASRLFFRNRLIKHDGIVSIKRGFKRKEWFNYLEKTTIPVNACSIRWHFPFRWIVEIRKWTM